MAFVAGVALVTSTKAWSERRVVERDQTVGARRRSPGLDRHVVRLDVVQGDAAPTELDVAAAVPQRHGAGVPALRIGP